MATAQTTSPVSTQTPPATPLPVNVTVTPTIPVVVQLPPVADPHWTAYVTAVATPVAAVMAAVLAGIIAYRNWKTAQNKLRLDLFKERLAMYRNLDDLLEKISHDKWNGLEDFATFSRLVFESKFMFGKSYTDWANKGLLGPVSAYTRWQFAYANSVADTEEKYSLGDQKEAVKEAVQDANAQMLSRLRSDLMLFE